MSLACMVDSPQTPCRGGAVRWLWGWRPGVAGPWAGCFLIHLNYKITSPAPRRQSLRKTRDFTRVKTIDPSRALPQLSGDCGGAPGRLRPVAVIRDATALLTATPQKR